MENKQLIDWKTDAWKNRDMVAWYAKRMEENTGSNRLKNRIETELCERFLTGSELLDVGIGTGRASLPLARKGFKLTGTDSSQAMLDECRRQAGALPVTLVPGDVKALPFPDARFDSLVSLNVMTHFPHVEAVLREWKRVVRPGGRLVFDIYALDHLSFSRGRAVSVDDLIALGADRFNMHLSLDRLVSAADEVGLTVVATAPYGALFSGEYRHSAFHKPLQETHWWLRQLSWLAQDDALLEMALFLDREWFGRLTSIVTGRYMVALENRADPAANASWLNNERALIGRLLGQPVRLDELSDRLALSAQAWRETFDRHLDRLRNRTVAYFLLSTCFGRPDAVDWHDLAPRNGSALARWAAAEGIDRQVQRFVRDWHRQPAVAPLTQAFGVDLASGLEYELQRQLLARTLGAFNGKAE